jgi:hypothetical protein
VPPFTGVPVKVTLVPAQMAPVGLAAMLTDAGKPLTVIVSVLEVAGEPVTQARFEVTTHE